MIGNYIRTNMLIAAWESYNKVVKIDNSTLNFDGFLYGDLQSISSSLTNSVFNITMMQTLFYLRFGDACLTLKRGDMMAWLSF
jgi:hypothetical protein